MMIVLGNGSSFLGRYLGSYFATTANLVGLNTTWNFFSPDPAHTMYLKYIVHFEDEFGNPTQDSISDYYPKSNESFRLDIRRKSYVMRFLVSSIERQRQYLIPWLCRQYPGATRIQTETELHRIPSLDVAASQLNLSYEDFVSQEEVNAYVFECEK